jgi:hypothetical protein
MVGKDLKRISLLFILILGISTSLIYLVRTKFFKEERQEEYLCTKNRYFYPIEIREFSSQNIPCIEIYAENKTALVKVDFGIRTINLPSAFLDQIEKKNIGKEKFCGVRGKKYERKVYQLPKISIGDNINLFQVKIAETNLDFEKDAMLDGEGEGPLGRIGWGAFYGINVLIDCSNSLMAFCDSLDTLSKKGYPTQDFTEVPIVLDRGVIEFDATTEKGILHCMLDTGATMSLLNKDLDGSNDHMLLTPMDIDEEKFQKANPDNRDLIIFDPENDYPLSIFELSKKDFGPITFKKIKTPFQTDAIIGMDFIDNTLIYIDFINRKMYFLLQPLGKD